MNRRAALTATWVMMLPLTVLSLAVVTLALWGAIAFMAWLCILFVAFLIFCWWMLYRSECIEMERYAPRPPR